MAIKIFKILNSLQIVFNTNEYYGILKEVDKKSASYFNLYKILKKY